MSTRDPGRRFLFRTYLIIAGGLVAIGFVLDLGLERLHGRTTDTAAELAGSLLARAERELAALPPRERNARAAALGGEYGRELRVLPAGDVVGGQAGDDIDTLEDADGNLWYLYPAPALDAVLQFGPFAPAGNGGLARFVPPLFYLSVFLLVGAWLWPLVRDLNRISSAAREFASDYRKPIRTRDETRVLQDLAGNLDDMSARIQELIRNQKELASALSHEMRTPLARIKFAMAVMGDKSGVAGELESIEQDIAEMDALIATMLDFARLDHPGTEIHWQRTPTGEWLDECVAKARGRGPGIDCDNALAGRSARMDPALMGLALSNLLVNACKYATSRVSVTLAADGETGILTVDDDGPGIPPADRETVFDAFTRLDDSRSKQTGGHGLGLAIVARVAALHGGSVRADAAPGGGARFVIRWPASPA